MSWGDRLYFRLRAAPRCGTLLQSAYCGPHCARSELPDTGHEAATFLLLTSVDTEAEADELTERFEASGIRSSSSPTTHDSTRRAEVQPSGTGFTFGLRSSSRMASGSLSIRVTKLLLQWM